MVTSTTRLLRVHRGGDQVRLAGRRVDEHPCLRVGRRHGHGEPVGDPHVERQRSARGSGLGRPERRAALRVDALTSTFLPSLFSAMAVQMVLVVLPTPPFMFAMAMMRGTFVSLFSISVSFFSIAFP